MQDSIDREAVARLLDLSPKERMALPRQPMPEQEPAVRATNFREVPAGYTPMMAVQEAARCLACKKPACVELPPVAAPTGKHVGIVGAGPAGLTAAIDLRRAGHAVTL
jgi:glutamate synthase (NADPH/NADH) small chain